MKKNNLSILLYLIPYGLISLLTLTMFPLVHSDETWLAGLTNDYLRAGSLFVSESFFDLMPRTVHVIKTLYHLLQIPFIKIFGYSIFSVRLLSLSAGLLTLMIFNKLLMTILDEKHNKDRLPLLGAIYLSTNIQFLYASHFARQEMLLVLSLFICLMIYTMEYKQKQFMTAMVIGLSIGLHPNSFIIACMIGILYLKDWVTKKITLKDLLTFIAVVGTFGLLFAGISLIANPNFIPEYMGYGQTLSVDAPPARRLENFIDFYLKIYYQITGTYYIPDLKGVLISGYAFSCFHLLAGFTRAVTRFKTTRLIPKKLNRQESNLWRFNRLNVNLSLMAVAYNIAIFIIGRFNTTSIIFLVVILVLQISITLILLLDLGFGYLMKGSDSSWPGSHQATVTILVFMLLTVLNLKGVYDDFKLMEGHDYTSYEQTLKTYIDEDSVVLGNLSSGFIFQDVTFYDIRNLAYLEGTGIEDYVAERDINTIIYYEEYDYINRNPQWTILYGDDAYYNDLSDFLQEKTTIKGSFEDSFYGSRIIRYMGDYPWTVYIYEVD